MTTKYIQNGENHKGYLLFSTSEVSFEDHEASKDQRQKDSRLQWYNLDRHTTCIPKQIL